MVFVIEPFALKPSRPQHFLSVEFVPERRVCPRTAWAQKVTQKITQGIPFPRESLSVFLIIFSSCLLCPSRSRANGDSPSRVMADKQLVLFNPSPSIKRSQRTLFECFGKDSAARPDETESHKKVRKILRGDVLVEFENKLKAFRDVMGLHVLSKVKKEARAESTSLVDPSLRGRGVSRGLKRMGRPKGSMRRDNGKTHKREHAAPILRRDPTAFEKLTMINFCEKLLEKDHEKEIKRMTERSRREFENKYHFPFEYLVRWFNKKESYKAFVAKHRLGKHGLRPCGLRGRNIFVEHASRGARISSADVDEPSVTRPLARVFAKMKEWLNCERQHGHEV